MEKNEIKIGKVIYAYDDEGAIISNGVIERDTAIKDFISQDFIKIYDKESGNEIKIPKSSIGNLRIFNSLFNFLNKISDRKTDEKFMEENKKEFVNANIHCKNGGGLSLNYVFKVKEIEGWSAFYCFDNQGFVFIHLMPPKSVKYFEFSKYTIEECPFKDKFINLLDENFIENGINVYLSLDKNKPSFKNFFKSYIKSHGFTDLEFTFALSYGLYILKNSEEYNEFINEINEIGEEAIKNSYNETDDENKDSDENKKENNKPTEEETKDDDK